MWSYSTFTYPASRGQLGSLTCEAEATRYSSFLLLEPRMM